MKELFLVEAGGFGKVVLEQAKIHYDWALLDDGANKLFWYSYDRNNG